MRGDTERRGSPQIDVSWRQRLRYRFDNVLARGTAATLAWLGVVTFGTVLFSATLLKVFGVTFTGGEDSSLFEDIWQSMLRTLDPGTMAGDVGWGRRILSLMITLFGILVAGTLIGIIAAGVEHRIDNMRRGRSTVIESGHLVIAGGTSRIPAIIQQLVLAHAGKGPGTVVVLAPADPTELRRDVNDTVPDHGRTKIVYRFGDPTVAADLALARISEARGVIVLPTSDDDDFSVTQTVLAVDAEFGGAITIPVVVEVHDPTTALRLVHACGPTVHPIVTRQAIARIGAFALRQRGLGKVVNELIDFRGSDLHIARWPEFVGMRFDEIVGRVTNARPLGIARADGQFELNPPAESVVTAADRLIVIADSVDGVELAASSVRLPHGRATDLLSTAAEEHILIVGWNPLGPDLLEGWASSTALSSTVEVAFDPRLIDPDDVVVPDLGVDVRLSPTPEVSSLSLDRVPTTIVVLGYTAIDSAAADARTRLDVMHLRRRVAPTGATPRLVVQMLADDHADLTDLTGPDDLLISAALGSQFIARLIEQPERRAVLLELYGGDHASIRLVRCDLLGLIGTVTTADIVATAYAAGVLAIGWRTADDGNVVLNPHVDQQMNLSAGDELVVVG
jgi:voltage-gated potassium channel Kch/K+/H+ antiporter YhaU regulatory subunit KhtT